MSSGRYIKSILFCLLLNSDCSIFFPCSPQPQGVVSFAVPSFSLSKETVISGINCWAGYATGWERILIVYILYKNYKMSEKPEPFVIYCISIISLVNNDFQAF